MNKVFASLFSSIRAKATGLWNKVRLWTSPTFWQTQGAVKLREFFTKLFDIKPRHKKDYYPVLGWLISKRLAYALVISLCVGCLSLLYMLAPRPAPGGGGSPRAYRYNSAALKFYEGNARILAAKGYTAYIGAVGGGAANGRGVLYGADGGVVYEGDFADSRYNGEGVAYYSGSVPRYSGGFSDNLYSGAGKYYRQTGILEYEGEYAAGVRSGKGTLYNAAGGAVYAGSFRYDKPVYAELLGKTTAEAAELYTGASRLYSAADGACSEMDEIGVVCSLADGASSVRQEWTIDGVYAAEGAITVDGKRFESIKALAARFGAAEYEGLAAVTLAEAVAINRLRGEAVGRFGAVAITATADFDESLTVSAYDKSAEVYLTVFQSDGLLYTFYAEKAGTDRFDLYCISETGKK